MLRELLQYIHLKCKLFHQILIRFYAKVVSSIKSYCSIVWNSIFIQITISFLCNTTNDIISLFNSFRNLVVVPIFRCFVDAFFNIFKQKSDLSPNAKFFTFMFILWFTSPLVIYISGEFYNYLHIMYSIPSLEETLKFPFFKNFTNFYKAPVSWFVLLINEFCPIFGDFFLFNLDLDNLTFMVDLKWWYVWNFYTPASVVVYAEENWTILFKPLFISLFIIFTSIARFFWSYNQLIEFYTNIEITNFVPRMIYRFYLEMTPIHQYPEMISVWWEFFGNTSVLSNIFIFFGIFFILSILASLFFMNSLGLYGSFVLSTFSLFLFWLSALPFTFYTWINNGYVTSRLGKWFVWNSDITVYFDFVFDSLSLSFALLVLSIAIFINIYTFAYFRYEPNVTRLILLIDIFVVSMVILVTGGNLMVMYLGWELIGITSFFLINFWATRTGTVKAGYKAFLFNKVSDCCILLAVVLIIGSVGKIEIYALNSAITSEAQSNLNYLFSKWPVLHSVTYLLLIAAFIKSAQFGFHVWLPDSMEAPVPASALIHSATLVSAGIFLILRLYPIFEVSPFARLYIITFGSITCFFGGVCSIKQTDVKRLLAYSTISHCGALMFLTFFKNPDIVIIYLYVHGFFKAIIFMCMGHVIRFADNHQDMRRMGGFYKYLPFEVLITFIALLNLGGIGFTWGYYMKHFMFLDSSPESTYNLLCFSLVVLGSLCGIIYSYILFYYVFFDFKKAKKHVYFKLENEQKNNIYYTNASLGSNIAISGLTIVAYVLSSYLIIKYLNDHHTNLDLTFLTNTHNDLKNFLTNHQATFYFYLNWFIVILITFILFNNWKNTLNPSFSIKFFTLSWAYMFFFYIFYSILII